MNFGVRVDEVRWSCLSRFESWLNNEPPGERGTFPGGFFYRELGEGAFPLGISSRRRRDVFAGLRFLLDVVETFSRAYDFISTPSRHFPDKKFYLDVVEAFSRAYNFISTPSRHFRDKKFYLDVVEAFSRAYNFISTPSRHFRDKKFYLDAIEAFSRLKILSRRRKDIFLLEKSWR